MASGYAKEYNLRARLDETGSRLALELEALEGPERASVLILTNQMLGLAGHTWGKAVAEDPSTAPRVNVTAALDALCESCDHLRNISKWTGANDPVMRQIMATDVCLITIGSSQVPAIARAVTDCWRIMWKTRAMAGQALVMLRDWERITGADAVPRKPDGSQQSDAEIMASCAMFPPFLRRRSQP